MNQFYYLFCTIAALMLTIIQPHAYAALGDISLVQILERGVGISGLDGADSLTLSPDGQFLYAQSIANNSIAVFGVDEDTGRLFWSATYTEESTGFENISSPREAVIAPDGKFIYVSGGSDDALNIFARDTGSGRLTPVESILDVPDNDPPLDNPRALALSPDGAHLYVPSSTGDSVALFNRNAIDGGLTFVEAYVDNTGSISGLNGPVHAYVHPDGKTLYALTFNSGALVAFTRNETDGTLTYLQTIASSDVDDWSGPSDLVAVPGTNDLYLTQAFGNAVMHLERAMDGTLTVTQTLVDGEGGVSGITSPRNIIVRADGTQLYVAGRSSDTLTWFERDTSTGALTFGGSIADGTGDVDGLENVNALALLPDDRLAAASDFNDNILTVFDISAADGEPDFIEDYRDGDQAPEGIYGDLLVDDRQEGTVYVGSSNQGGIEVLERQLNTGLLRPQQYLDPFLNPGQGIGSAAEVVVSPDGSTLYNADDENDAIGVYSIDPQDGTLAFTQTIIGAVAPYVDLDNPQVLRVSPDGKNAYAFANDTETLFAFVRNTVTGSLSLLNQIARTDFSSAQDFNAYGIAIPPDGKHLYLANFDDVYYFSRDANTGALDFVSSIVGGPNPDDSLYLTELLSFTRDGRYMYANAFRGIDVYTRNPVGGGLGFVQQFRSDDDLGDRPLDQGALHPLDGYYYVADGDTLFVAVRNRDDGTLLAPRSFGLEDLGVVDSLDDIWVSADGRYAYVRAGGADRLYVFQIDGDFVAPEITVLGDDPFTLEQGQPYIEPGTTATDDLDGEITARITATNDIDNQTLGSYTVTYEVFDTFGNISTATRTVEVVAPSGEGEGEPEGMEGEAGVEGEPAEGSSEGLPMEGAVEEGENFLEGEGQHYHSADTDESGFLSLNELLRIIQFFNAARLGCDNETEDGFAPNGADENCAAHSSDYNPQDWMISLSELLRAIQLFSLGAYEACGQGGEDGYCPV